MTIPKKRFTAILLIVITLLLIPLIAMQFTDQVDWILPDFIIMGGLLLGTGLVCDIVWRKIKNVEHRLAVISVVLLTLFLIWAELAVGPFGTPFAGS